jgi:ectoine hydroxylase-related dioxygenase (phytanoyl-CoA dioxygenase family)
VCLYYVTDSDGDTIFFDDNENEIKRVSPKKGRIAFFDGTINHCSSNPTKLHRSVINFDFIGEYLDKQK